MAISSDWEPWAVANEILRQHGANAAIFSGMRADQLFEVLGLDAVHNWLLIIDRIEQMLAKPAGALH